MSFKMNEGSYGCIYYPGLTCKLKKSKSKNNIISKIQINNAISKNEIEIGEILKKAKIKGLISIKSSCIIKKNIELKNVMNCSIIENGLELVKIDQEYIKGDKLENFLTNENLINIYIKCLKLIKKLHNLNICHFDLHGDNILYNIDDNAPSLIDYGISINIDKLKNKNNYEEYFFRYHTNNYWSIDIIILNYVINNKKIIKNENEAKNIVQTFIKSDFFKNCSIKFKEIYFEECLNYVNSFINKSIPHIKTNLLKKWKSWDIYSLGILFIEFANILYFKNIKFLEILFESIHPNPKKRLTINEILKKI